MRVRTIFFFILFFINAFSHATSMENDEDWDKEFTENCPENTVKKKSNSLTKLSVSSYDRVIEQFRIHRMSLGILGGGFWGTHGTGQHINIDNLIGNYYSVSNPKAGGGIFGVNLYIKSLLLDSDEYELLYAISSFFMPHTTVTGYVTQENLVTNLQYQYQIYNISNYLGINLYKVIEDSRLRPTVNFGLGVNRVTTGVYFENSLTPYSVPDAFFRETSSYTFSFYTGAGLKLTNAFGKSPIECGYRFLYLGQGKLNSVNNLVTENLKTGYNYANVLACEFIIG